MKSLLTKAVAIVGLCVAAAYMSGCQKTDAQERKQEKTADSTVVKVVVEKIQEKSFEDWGSYSADLRGIEDANLNAPMQGGRVNSIKPIGTRVKAGESLCDIDNEKYEAALEAAKAQVEIAKGDLERAKANVEKGSLGRSAIDAANLMYQNSRVALAVAQRAYQDCRCEAPFDGILVSRSIERYQAVAPGAPTVRLSRLDRFEAVISVPETEAFSVAEGMKTEFRLLQNPNKVYTGTLKSLDKAVDTRTRTVMARIELANSDGSLKPGMVGRANILRKAYTKAVVVPSSAIVRLQNGVSAMVVENGIAKQRIIQVGATTDNTALITDGLHSGDLLIVSGAFQVSNGTKVVF